MALEWQGKMGDMGYMEDGTTAYARAARGPALCSCDKGPLVDTREEEQGCLRCGKPVRGSGRRAPGVGRVAA